MEQPTSFRLHRPGPSNKCGPENGHTGRLSARHAPFCLATVAPMTDRDPDELLALVIEAVAGNLPGEDADVIELPVEDDERLDRR